MRNKKIIIIYIIFLFFFSCSKDSGSSISNDISITMDVSEDDMCTPCCIYPISMTRLIVTPEKYAGKMVLFTGFLALDPTEERIYLSKEDYELLNFENSIRISNIDKVRDYIKKYDLKYVHVRGVLHKVKIPELEDTIWMCDDSSHYSFEIDQYLITDIKEFVRKIEYLNDSKDSKLRGKK